MERNYNPSLSVSDIGGWIFERSQIDDEKLKEMMDSISNDGVIEPIIVRETEEGKQGLAGNLRFTAVCNLGQKTLPAIVYKDISDKQALVISAIENIQRQELGDYDKANIMLELKKTGMTQDQIADALAITKGSVSQYLTIVEKDTKTVRRAVATGRLTEKKARYVRKLPEAEQRGAIKKVQELTVKQTANFVEGEGKKDATLRVKKLIEEQEGLLSEVEKAKEGRAKIEGQITEIKAQLKSVKVSERKTMSKIRQRERVKRAYFDDVNLLEETEVEVQQIKRELENFDIGKLDGDIETNLTDFEGVKRKIGELVNQLAGLREKRDNLKDLVMELKRRRNDAKVLENRGKDLESKSRKLKDEIKKNATKYKKEIANFDTWSKELDQKAQQVAEQRSALLEQMAELVAEKRRINGTVNNEKRINERLDGLRKELKAVAG